MICSTLVDESQITRSFQCQLSNESVAASPTASILAGNLAQTGSWPGGADLSLNFRFADNPLGIRHSDLPACSARRLVNCTPTPNMT
jgi:hypothetical protein